VLAFRVRQPEMAEAVSDATAADAVADFWSAAANAVVAPGADESGQDCWVDPFFHVGVAFADESVSRFGGRFRNWTLGLCPAVGRRHPEPRRRQGIAQMQVALRKRRTTSILT
jgi:hypothetical protein